MSDVHVRQAPAKSRRLLLRHPLLLAVVGSVVSALITAVVAFVQPSPGAAVLVPVDRVTAYPFVPGVHDPQTPSPDISPARPDRDPVGHGGTVDGTSYGAFGRTGTTPTCNVAALSAYFKDPRHVAQARTWAGVAGIAPAAIPGYLAKLTPVRLRADTWVTNYDYRDGHADGFPAILQAGTSVLVDSHGIPRAKCNCGNPLAEPARDLDSTSDVERVARNPQEAWDGFNPANAVTLTAGRRPVNSFVLLDLDDGEAHKRPTGSAGAVDTPLTRTDPACRTFTRLVGCGGPGVGTTAADRAALERTVRALVDAIGRRDCSALVNLLSTAAARLSSSRQSSVADCQEAFAELDSLGGVTVKDVKVVSQTGARAVISGVVTFQGKSDTAEQHLVRENGSWKIDSAG